MQRDQLGISGIAFPSSMSVIEQARIFVRLGVRRFDARLAAYSSDSGAVGPHMSTTELATIQALPIALGWLQAPVLPGGWRESATVLRTWCQWAEKIRAVGIRFLPGPWANAESQACCEILHIIADEFPGLKLSLQNHRRFADLALVSECVAQLHHPRVGIACSPDHEVMVGHVDCSELRIVVTKSPCGCGQMCTRWPVSGSPVCQELAT